MAKDEGTVQTAIRIPGEWMLRFQEIASRLSRPGIGVTSSDAMRAAMAEGLMVLEAQLKIASPKASGEGEIRATRRLSRR